MSNNDDSDMMKSLKIMEEEKKIEENKKACLRMRKYRANRTPKQRALDKQKSNYITKKN